MKIKYILFNNHWGGSSNLETAERNRIYKSSPIIAVYTKDKIVYLEFPYIYLINHWWNTMEEGEKYLNEHIYAPEIRNNYSICPCTIAGE